MSSGTAITTAANDLIFGAGVSDNVVTAPGTGFTARDLSFGNVTEDRLAAVPGPYSATATHNGKQWGMLMVAFRAPTASVTADTTVPSVPVGVIPVATSTSQINVTWTASTDPDNSAGQISYSVFRNGGRLGITSPGLTTWLDSGLTSGTTYSYTVAAQDPAGNTSLLSAPVQASTMTPAPTINSFTSNPVSITAGQSAILSWSVSNATTITIDNGVGVVSGGSAVIHPQSTTAYTLTASNSGGSSIAVTIETVTPDTAPPSVPVLSVRTTSSSEIDLSWPASTDNVAVSGYQLYRDGVQIAQPSATNFADTGLNAGQTYTYTATARDLTGNISAPSSPVAATTTNSADTQAPTISITAPGGNQLLSGSAIITANASDNIGVVGVEFVVDGTNLGAELSASPYSASWDTTKFADGTHTVSAVARDAAGNSATASAVTVNVSNGVRRPYFTNFSSSENPIAEGGNWINGAAVGLDWEDVRTVSGLAFGTQDGSINFNDSTALLAGTWGPDQTVQGTVHTVNQSDSFFEEVELRLRSSIGPHSNTGYEVNFRCSSTANAYSQIVRWNGALGDFTLLDSRGGAQFALKDGDVVKATIVGNVITSYINGVQALQVVDNTYSSGNPGIGFYMQGSTANVDQDFGFTNFTASDGTSTDVAPPSTPMNLTGSAISPAQANLTWTASTDDVGVAGYQIYRDNVQVGTSTATSYSDSGLTANTTYTYTVVASDSAGHTSSPSSPFAITTPGPDIVPPTAPTGLQSSGATSSTIAITWTASTDNVGVAGYQVFRNGNIVGTASGTSFTDSGLAPATTYSYTVAAFDDSNNVSPQSQPLLVTTLASAQVPPKFVQVNHAQVGSGSSVSVAFNATTNQGNTLVVYVIWDNTGTVTLSDSGKNVFRPASPPVTWAGKFSAQVFYASNIAGGSDTIVATFGSAVTSFGVTYIHEYAGIDPSNPIDVTSSANGSSSTLNSGAATTTSPNDLIFGAGVSDNIVTAIGANFTARDMAFGNVTEDRVAAAAGATSATATHNGKAWGMQMVAFRPAN